jgi:hypothetical protein
LGLRNELDTALDKLFVGLFNIRACKRTIERHPWLKSLFVELEYDEMRFRRADTQLDPTLVIVERLVCVDLEADLLRPELNRAFLL